MPAMSTAVASDTPISTSPTTISAATTAITLRPRERISGSTLRLYPRTLVRESRSPAFRYRDAWGIPPSGATDPGVDDREKSHEGIRTSRRARGLLPGRARRRARRGPGSHARRRAAQPRRRRDRGEDHRLRRQARTRVRLVARPGGLARPLHALHPVRLRRPGEPDEGRRDRAVLRRRRVA